jgi:hypothetical protein
MDELMPSQKEVFGNKQNTMNRLLLLCFLILSGVSIAQKDGKYFSDDDPVNYLWELVNSEADGAMMAGEAQQFFFIIGGGSEKSMMAPFEMEGMGFACPTYFKASSDSKYIYIDIIGDPCALGLPMDQRYFKVAYSINTSGTILSLIVDGKKSDYKHWD